MRTSGSTPSATQDDRTPPPSSPFLTLRRGDAPEIGYVQGRVHVARDGVRTRLPLKHGISEIARYDGGFLAADIRYFEGTSGLSIVDHGRVEPLQPCTTGGGAVDRGRTRAAWATFACPESGVPAPTVLHLRSATGTTRQHISGHPLNLLTAVAGFLGDDIVYNVGWSGGAYATDLRSEPRRLQGLKWVASIDEVGRRLAGGVGPDGRHAVVVDVDGHPLWRARRTRLIAFNPSGTAIVGSSGRRWAVLDAVTGRDRYVLHVP